jgi:N-acetylneuraminate synthase/N,N'-diacetyllegionaminate synthase
VVAPSIELAGRTIGTGTPPFVVAEAGVNHNGQPDLALALVDAAAEAGADAVKFQTFSADALATAQAPQAAYQRERAMAASQVEMLRGLELPADGLRAARDRAAERGLFFLSTPFDLGALQLLVSLEVKAFKIGSGDLTNAVLLRAVAAQGLPMLLSTGMATLAEVDAAVDVVRKAGNPPLVVLQCTTAYPAAAADANLLVMEQMRERYRVPIGFSDHTIGMGAAIAAAALGAAIIEKHLTLDRNLPGPDHAASLPPAEFAAMVAGVRDAYAALGDGTKTPTAGEGEMRLVARRSLVANRPLVAGQIISEGDLDAMRPATGISPLRLDEVIGRRAARDLAERVPLMPDDLDPALPD